MTPDPELNEDQPLDPAVERVRRRMMRLMIVSIGIMMIGLMAVAGAIVYKLSGRETPRVATPAMVPGGYQSLLHLPAGSRVVAHSISGDRLTLVGEDPNGRQTVVLIDLASGEEIGRIDIVTD